MGLNPCPGKPSNILVIHLRLCLQVFARAVFIFQTLYQSFAESQQYTRVFYWCLVCLKQYARCSRFPEMAEILFPLQKVVADRK